MSLVRNQMSEHPDAHDPFPKTGRWQGIQFGNDKIAPTLSIKHILGMKCYGYCVITRAVADEQTL